MNRALLIKNRQRVTPLNTRLLRRITDSLLTDLIGLESFDLGIYLVQAPEMARLNKTYLQHEGSTDVITFDYSDHVPSKSGRHVEPGLPARCRKHVHGEIFICVDDAKKQARQFRTSWQSELARYVIHGVLHLRGFDDLQPAARRKMKREENRLLKEVDHRFPLRKLSASPKLAT